MSLKIVRNAYSYETAKNLVADFEKRIIASPPYACPVELNIAFLRLCHAESCGKCNPCSIGLGDLIDLHEEVLDGCGNEKVLELIRETAKTIADTADCVIGKYAGEVFLRRFEETYDDYKNHIEKNQCILGYGQPIPCASMCPAHIDIPGYIALVHEKKYAEAIKLIRKDNPFPTACGLICEHPCEKRCRRKMVDAAVSIRGIKRYAVDMCHADTVPVPKCMDATGKKVAVIGGGPSGLTAAYYLQLMGHKVTVFEGHNKLGGMMRYGIPAYRFPRERLDEDIKAILSTGIEVKYNTQVGKDVKFSEIKNSYDAVYVAIGAQIDKKIKLDGQDAENVFPAVDILREIGDGKYPDYSEKTVLVVGGGNVAMDCARTAIRSKAKSVRVIYRRKQEDMTAQQEEIHAAIEEGVIMETLKSPFKIIKNGNVATGLETELMMCSKVDEKGRFGVKAIEGAEHKIYNADVIIIATGQDIDTAHFEAEGLKAKKNLFITNDFTVAEGEEKVFIGGDCVFGPTTVIKAIEAGKVATKAIDKYLGFEHTITCDVEIPKYKPKDLTPCARVDMVERDPEERKKDFNQSEILMCEAEMLQETDRCLRCDYKGCSLFKGGRKVSW